MKTQKSSSSKVSSTGSGTRRSPSRSGTNKSKSSTGPSQAKQGRGLNTQSPVSRSGDAKSTSKTNSKQDLVALSKEAFSPEQKAEKLPVNFGAWDKGDLIDPSHGNGSVSGVVGEKFPNLTSEDVHDVIKMVKDGKLHDIAKTFGLAESEVGELVTTLFP